MAESSFEVMGIDVSCVVMSCGRTGIVCGHLIWKKVVIKVTAAEHNPHEHVLLS